MATDRRGSRPGRSTPFGISGRFAQAADEHLEALACTLGSGNFSADPLTDVAIEKHADDGTVHDARRQLQVPSVRDRIVERAVLHAVTPYVDPVLGSSAFAYRPGLGVRDAIQAVVDLREEGFGWALRADVHDCFPSIPVPIARRRLTALVPDDAVLSVVDELLARRSRDPRGRLHGVRGLPQGCALSPMLSNLVLVVVDEALARAGFPVVRYADDFVVACGSRDEAWEAARVATEALDELGMQLGADKTEVMSFADGFCFLGEDFGSRYPPSLALDHGARVERRTVYVATQGSRLRMAAGRLRVESKADEVLLDVPSTKVARVVCFGSIGVSAGARGWGLSAGVPFVFASRSGSYQGQLAAGSGRAKIERLRCQLELRDDARAALARAIVEAKLRKQLVLVQRFGRRSHVETVNRALPEIRGLLEYLPDCGTRDEIMRIEGAAAKCYFAALGELSSDQLTLAGRSRRPPRDAGNAALSFAYTILLGEAETAIIAAGLDPTIGVLHADDDRRPSLALDLMEEFRPLVVDQAVMRAARHGALTDAHGRTEPGSTGVLLTKAGRAALVDGYEQRMVQQTRGALPDFSGSME